MRVKLRFSVPRFALCRALWITTVVLLIPIICCGVVDFLRPAGPIPVEAIIDPRLRHKIAELADTLAGVQARIGSTFHRVTFGVLIQTATSHWWDTESPIAGSRNILYITDLPPPGASDCCSTVASGLVIAIATLDLVCGVHELDHAIAGQPASRLLQLLRWIYSPWVINAYADVYIDLKRRLLDLLHGDYKIAQSRESLHIELSRLATEWAAARNRKPPSPFSGSFDWQLPGSGPSSLSFGESTGLGLRSHLLVTPEFEQSTSKFLMAEVREQSISGSLDDPEVATAILEATRAEKVDTTILRDRKQKDVDIPEPAYLSCRMFWWMIVIAILLRRCKV